jgi:hypothetical protein
VRIDIIDELVLRTVILETTMLLEMILVAIFRAICM